MSLKTLYQQEMILRMRIVAWTLLFNIMPYLALHVLVQDIWTSVTLGLAIILVPLFTMMEFHHGEYLRIHYGHVYIVIKSLILIVSTLCAKTLLKIYYDKLNHIQNKIDKLEAKANDVCKMD